MDLESAIARSHLICVDVMENHNKFWSAWVLENGDLLVEYGRVGSTAQSKLHAIGSVNAATNKMNSLVKQKQAKGYQVIAIADSKSLDYSLLTNGSVIQDDIEAIQQQWKRMEPFSLIRFHPESGQFRSLSGGLSADVVTIARSHLGRLPKTTKQTCHRHPRSIESTLESDRLGSNIAPAYPVTRSVD